ncbi:MAG: methyltransferase domain-containing protein [Cyanobacteria bacterium P01_G01_bin.54]
MKPDNILEWICSSKNNEELKGNYDQWASTYELDIAEFWKKVPLKAAAMLSKYLASKQETILDFGAGTGMVGVALSQLGFNDIIGIDISSGMLEKAGQTGVYKSLTCGSILDETINIWKKVSGVVATGVFAERHAGIAELKVIQSKLQSGGVFVFTVRQSFLAQLQPMLKPTQWTALNSEMMPIYDDPMYLLAYRKI